MKKLALTICALFIAALAFAVAPTQASANYDGSYGGYKNSYQGYGGKPMVRKAAYKKPVKKAAYRGQGGYYRQQAVNHAHVNAYNVAAHHGGYGYGGYHRVQPDGKILVTWDKRADSTCHIAYTESGGDAYQYKTEAHCRDGQAVIGGLVPGMEYKFAVHAEGSPHWYGEEPAAHAVALY